MVYAEVGVRTSVECELIKVLETDFADDHRKPAWLFARQVIGERWFEVTSR